MGWDPGSGARRGARTYLLLALGRGGVRGWEPAWHSPAPPRASSASAQHQGARGLGRVRCLMLGATCAGAPLERSGLRWWPRRWPRPRLRAGKGAAGRSPSSKEARALLGGHPTPPPAAFRRRPSGCSPALLLLQPCVRASPGPSMTHRSPRVRPRPVFHFPLGNVTLPPSTANSPARVPGRAAGDLGGAGGPL